MPITPEVPSDEPAVPPPANDGVTQKPPLTLAGIAAIICAGVPPVAIVLAAIGFHAVRKGVRRGMSLCVVALVLTTLVLVMWVAGLVLYYMNISTPTSLPTPTTTPKGTTYVAELRSERPDLAAKSDEALTVAGASVCTNNESDTGATATAAEQLGISQDAAAAVVKVARRSLCE